jgi:ribosomal protein S16
VKPAQLFVAVAGILTFALLGAIQALYGPLYPASTNSDVKVFNDGWTAKPLVSAGPFKFDKWVKDGAQPSGSLSAIIRRTARAAAKAA